MDSEIVEQPQAEEATAASESVVESQDQEHADKAAETTTDEQKPTKTPEQRELEKARRRIDKLTKRLYAQEAVISAQHTQKVYDPDNDDEPVTLTKAELQRRIQEEARKAAPTIAKQDATIQQRQAVIAALDKELGTERFNEVAADLDEALGGLADSNGLPKPATEAIFESEHPRQLIEYLADPDHEDEAKAIGKMSAIKAAQAILKIEEKLAAKPKPSKAAEPLAPVKAAASGKKSIFDMSDEEFFKSRQGHGKRK